MFHFKNSLNKVKYGKQIMFFVNNIEKLNFLKYTQFIRYIENQGTSKSSTLS